MLKCHPLDSSQIADIYAGTVARTLLARPEALRNADTLQGHYDRLNQKAQELDRGLVAVLLDDELQLSSYAFRAGIIGENLTTLRTMANDIRCGRPTIAAEAVRCISFVEATLKGLELTLQAHQTNPSILEYTL